MGSRSGIFALCLLATLAAVACGTDDDSSNPGNTAGHSGKGNAGTSANAGSSGKAGNAGSENGGTENPGEGGSAGTDDGMAGAGGQPTMMDCTHLSDFVHTVIKEDTTAKSVPRPVNGVVFCDDPANPAAYNDLF